MALQTLTGSSLQLPSSGHRPSMPLALHLVRPGHRSQCRRRRRPLSFPTTAGISLQLPSSGHRPSIPLAPHVVRPVHLSQCRLHPLSSSATAASAFSSASAAPPLTSRRSQDIQPLDELLQTDGAGLNGGTSGGGGGAVGGHDGDSNRKAAIMVPPRDDWSQVASETEDQAALVPGSVVSSSSELERFLFLRKLEGLMQRLVADDLFLAKVATECGLGTFTKNFFKEPEIVLADAAMAIVADFMLAHLLPAPTASLTPALLAKFFHCFPVNAVQIAFPGSSYSLAHRLCALVLNGAKLFVVGTISSMVRTAMRSALIDARKVAGKSSGGEVGDVPILSASVAYGVYMAISDNLRSQVLDGVIEQRILEPLLHQHKHMLSAIRFAVRTGDTFFGSLLWIH